jgi:SprT-like family
VPDRAALVGRLVRLGLPAGTRVTLTHNRTVLVSWTARGGLRLHAGYARAPDAVLRAIVRFLEPKVPRKTRLAARHRFLAFPVERYARSRPRPVAARRVVPAAHREWVARLTLLRDTLNRRHFGGRLSAIPIRLSERMSTSLGELRSDRAGRPTEIVLSRRHLVRDAWSAVTDTLLHEMVHQWQGEHGLPINHGQTFRTMAHRVGILARGRVDLADLPRRSA